MVARPTDTIQRIHPPKGRLVFYEDRLIDGRVPIEMMQSNAIKRAATALDHLPDGEEFTYMDSNLPIRFDLNDLRVSIAPDYYRSKNVNVSAIRDQTAYNLWEVGKPPEFVLEVASRSAYEKDLYEKLDIYAGIGVLEYWMFDPTGGDLYGQGLMGFKLMDVSYKPIETVPNEHGLMSGYSEELGLRLCAMDRSKRDEMLRLQPSLALVFAGNHQPSQLLFQAVNTGLYLLNMRAMKVEYERAGAELEAKRRQAEDALEEERDARTREREERDARIRELEDRLRSLEG